MKKKNVVGVSLVVVLVSAILAGGFWYVNDVKKQEREIVEGHGITNKGNAGVGIESQLSVGESEKLKKKKDLVWYEIPEMNIKFLVTKDTNKDLSHQYSSQSNRRNIIFTSRVSCLSGECAERRVSVNSKYNFFQLIESSIYDIESDKSTMIDNILYSDNSRHIFFSNNIKEYIKDGVIDNEEYVEMLNIEMSDKTFGIYASTVWLIDDYSNICSSNYGRDSQGKCSVRIDDRNDFLFFHHADGGENLGYGYYRYNNKIYSFNPNPQSVATMCLLDANVDTFEVLGGEIGSNGIYIIDSYAKDDQKGFNGCYEIDNVDINTFEVLKFNRYTPSGYAKDYKTVFFRGSVLEGADAKTFKLGKIPYLSDSYCVAADKNYSYVGSSSFNNKSCVMKNE